MLKLIGKRAWFLFGLSSIAIAISLLTDPDGNGLSTLLGGLSLLQGVWAVLLAHLSRKALTDYVEADAQNLFSLARETSVGSGLALIALAITFFGLLLVFSPRAHAENIPPGFIQYGPMLKAEQQKHWPNHPDPSLLASLIEQESCISLKSPHCWNPGSRLKSAREEGAGFGQITRAYRLDGSLRFDTLSDLKRQYVTELGGWSWDNVYQRPELQLRALVLMSRDNANRFKQTNEWLAFGDAAYNGGITGVQKERRACELTSGCDPSLWFDNVERYCLKSRQPLYGGRSACDINREHVRNVFFVRKVKYEGRV